MDRADNPEKTLRDEAANNALRQPDLAEDLRTALEETSVLAEELRAANEGLLATNEALDRRVLQRTLELSHANAGLERINAELNRRRRGDRPRAV